MDRRFASSLVIIAGLVGMSDPAAALVIEPAQVIATALPDQCATATRQVAMDGIGVGLALQSTKSSAILGGQTSALERIMQAQQGLVAASPAPVIPVSLQAARAENFNPAGGGLVPAVGGVGCSRLSLPKTAAPSGLGRGLGNDDFLLTRRLPVSHTAFDAEWSRVSNANLSVRSMHRMLPRQFLSGGIGLASVERVNAWANQRIRYAEDAKLYGRADYWANAESTLRKRAGDCEDIAIVKLQILAAMGVPRSDMFLTIARDLTRHADHALLVVRIDNRHWVLDNAVDRLLDANDNLDYQPVLSFSTDHKWLHGAITLALK